MAVSSSSIESQHVPPSSRMHAVAPFVPYLAVAIGMFALHSAWWAVFGYHAGMAAVLALDRGWGAARRLGMGRHPLHLIGTGVFGLSGGVLLYLCWPLLGLPRGFGHELAHLGITIALWPAFIVYFCAINPWLEEVYWRGYLGQASRRPVPHDFLFGGYHILVLAPFIWWPWLLLTLTGLVLAGWLWRQLARHTNGLLVPLVSHFIADTSIMVTVFLFTAQK